MDPWGPVRKTVADLRFFIIFSIPVNFINKTDTFCFVSKLKKGKHRTVRIKSEVADKIDALVESGVFKSRAQFVEKACLDFFISRKVEF